MIKIKLTLITCLFSIPAFTQLTVNKDSLSEFAFKDPIALNEIIVKAKRKNIDSRGLGNMRINMGQLQISPLFLGERDVIKILQFLPGVSGGMEGSSQLNIRGGTNDQTLYLIDDVPIYNQNHTFGLFSIFNSDAIKSVDLYKGGIPTQYGDKLSGVVSVALKDGDFKKHQTAVSLGVLAGTLVSEGPIIKDRLNYVFAGRRSFVDLLYNGIMKLSGGGNGENAMIAFYDINGKLNWKINTNSNLSWQIYAGYDDLYGANKKKNDYSKEKYSEKYGYGWKTIMTSLKYRSQLKSNLLLSSNIYYSGLNNFNYYKNKQQTPNFSRKIENGRSSLLTEIGGKATFEYKTNEKNTLYYGVEGAYQSYTPAYIYKQVDNNKLEYNTDQLKLFKFSSHIYDEFRFKQWFISLGIRLSLYNNIKNSKFTLEPRIKINTFAGEKNKLMLAYDRMFQPVHTINEMNYNVQTDFWIPFQETVLPNSHQISIGWKNYTSSNLNFSIEAYFKSMHNLLSINNLENYIDFHTAFETGKGSSTGIEFMAEYSKDKFTTWASYTLSKSKRSFGGKTYPFKYDAPHDLSAFASYMVYKKGNNTHTFSINAQYKTGYPYYIPEITYPGIGLPTVPSGYGEINNMFSVDHIPQYPNIRLKNYFRMDINYTIEKNLKHGSLIWQFSLLNVTNRKNPYVVYKKDEKYKAFVLIPIIPSISVKRCF